MSGDPMLAKITVNGVHYDSVDAMPADVRRVYEEMLAKFPDLADRLGDVAPQIVEGDVGPLHYMTSVRKKIIVNGTTYENETSMPSDVRQTYEQAMHAASTGTPTVKKNEIKMSFQVTGPGFHFGKALGGPPSGGAPTP